MSRLSASIVGMALLASACGGSDAPVDGGQDPTTSQADEQAATSVPSDDETNIDAGPEYAFTPIEIEPTEVGPRPLLEWEAIDGADEYYVVVLGSDGTPYWAWSGVSTSIHVGGVDDPEGIGAWVGEPMTWSVSALDASGHVLGLSASADLIP